MRKYIFALIRAVDFDYDENFFVSFHLRKGKLTKHWFDHFFFKVLFSKQENDVSSVINKLNYT